MRWHSDFRSSSAVQSGTPNSWFSEITQTADHYDPKTADAILAGRYQLLGLDESNTAWPPDWNQDPKSKLRAPLTFGKHIDYRNAEVVGDIKYVWEINRHLEFPVLAIAYKSTGDEKYLEALERALQAWLYQCPFPLGVNWCSALECAIRIINWSLMWQILGGDHGVLFSSDDHRDTRASLFKSIEHHLLYIRRNFSRFSSANNHLIGEAAGVFIACNTWSFDGQSGEWANDAKSILVQETLRQIGPDGVGREQAVGYVPFVLEFLLIAGAASQANDIKLPEEYWRRICLALKFLDSITDSSGKMANFGDSDDGAVLRIWGYDMTSRIRGLHKLANTLIADADKSHKSCDTFGLNFEQLDDSTRNTPVAFTDGGYYVLQTTNRRKDTLHCVFDCGPLGYLSTAAHGHADALSFVMNVDGQRVLVDPGTYAYHTERPWRDYFRGTAAHNTIRIDESDQSQIAGSFMWQRSAESTCESYTYDQSLQTVKASHDGYLRLTDPLLHARRVQLHTEPQQVVVTDELICKGTHFVELHWHLAPDCLVVEEGDSFRVTTATAEIVFRVAGNANLTMELVSGSTDPICGWYSDRFDRKVATNTLRWFGEIRGDTELKTDIQILRS